MIVGLDGCPRGWCGVSIDSAEPQQVTASHYASFADVLATDAPVICVDIPIGLLDGPGQRACDVAARKLLGPGRASSVFPAPCRAALAALDDGYKAACSANLLVSGKRLSRQAYNIAPKIRAVDAKITAASQSRVLETHPEVCFAALAGHSMRHRKSMVRGRIERWSVLGPLLPSLSAAPSLPAHLRGYCGIDDYIDALVCSWTALRVVSGKASTLPVTPQRDGAGLRMEIRYP